MRIFPYPILMVFALALLARCRMAEEGRESAQHKTDPYDQFAFQRSYPDQYFDSRAWHAAIARARSDESVQDRNTGCGGNPGAWTLQGPANVGGRANAVAVQPGNDLTVLAGFASGGIFKSTDGGVNWRPVFDDNADLAIGCLTFDPTDSNLVYAGTGDPNIPSVSFNGNGVYKSTDAGETWHYLGLGQEGIVSRIRINPLNTQVIFVSTMGNPAYRDNHRGIYKTTDGGLTWTQSLFVSDQAGASDLALNSVNPQILYAGFWDRIRNNNESIIYGPHAKIYKTTDGGATWTPLGGGLPTGVQGRIGLALSQQNPDKVYAVYVDTLSNPGGIYKSTDAGATWASVSIAGLQTAYSSFGWYFAQLRLNPANDEDVYFPAVLLWRKMPAGSWQPAAGGHSDSHDIVITPSGHRYWASDGGIYRSDPGQSNFVRCNNLPTTEIYHTDFNPTHPGTYFIGAQDNGFQIGNGAAINNWSTLFFADGFNAAYDPVDSNSFWIEIQNGTIYKTSDGGNSWGQSQNSFNTTDRTNWNAPFFMSPHNPPKRFGATYRVYESTGDTWNLISGNLTNDSAGMVQYHTVSALDESPVLAEKLLAGTSDGNIWRREPAGYWVKISAGLQNRYVSSIHGSPVSSDRIFVTYSGFSALSYVAHVLRSDDNGQNWADISGNLPPLPVNDLFVLPGQSDNVLCAATDAGVYLTLNGGQSWSRLGANMPFIPVFALERNPVQHQILAATYGRGLWTFPLDSLFNQPSATDVTVSGQLSDENGQGISAGQVAAQPDVFSGPSGLYIIPSVPGCQSYTVTPYRNDQPLNGVTTYDLALISKHILGIAALDSPYKLIAADANKSGTVTTLDILMLRRLILGIDSVLNGNNSWRFVRSGFVFPNPALPFQTPFPESAVLQLQTDPVSGLDFTGVKIGDVNNSASPALNGPGSDRTTGEWPLRFGDQTFNAGDRVEVEFSGDCTGMTGVQFSLHFNPAMMEAGNVEPLVSGLTPEHFGTNRLGAGVLSCCFENDAENPWTGIMPLFRITFRMRSSGRLSSALQIGGNPTLPLAYLNDGSALLPVLKPVSGPVSTARIWPDPAGNSGIWMKFPVSAESEYRLEIFDSEGIKVLETVLEGTDAKTGFHVAAERLSKAGVYFYRFGRAGETSFTGKFARL